MLNLKKAAMLICVAGLGSALALGGCGGGQPAQQSQQGDSSSATQQEQSASSDSGQQDAASGSDEKADSERTVVSREKIPDCDNPEHGYYEITYSDGSVETEDY